MFWSEMIVLYKVPHCSQKTTIKKIISPFYRINLNESLYNYYDYKIVNNDLEHLSTLIINNANLTYSGDYECILFNKYGNASRQMKIRIKS